MDFDEAFVRLIGHEGGYVSHPKDPGRATCWGVTEAVARESGYTGHMRDLPQAFAKVIARRRYWDVVRADDMPSCVRFDLFDTAYNSGPGQAVRLLQRALGVDDDGVIGPVTLAAARGADAALAARFNGHRLAFLADLSTWTTFGRGWARRIARNLQAA